MSARSILALAIAALVLLVRGRDAAADPRWWWDDVRLTDNATDSVTPHVVAPGYAAGGAGGMGAFITWAEVDPAGGDLEIWMTATFDMGCTFCPPIRITDDADEDARPRIAVLGLPTGTWSIAIAFESRNAVHVAWDSEVASFRVPRERLCPELVDVGPAIIANDQYIRFGAGSALADHPGICSASTQGFGHFHAAWRQVDLASAESRIWYAHDLTARGGPGWTMMPPRALPPMDAGGQDSEPAIACDVATDPDPDTGLTTRDRSAVNVVFVEQEPTDQVRLAGLRSVDSGTTFSPDGQRADAPAGPVGDPPAGPTLAVRHPAADAAGSTFTTDQPAWIGVAFDDDRAAPGQVRADARRIETAVVPAPDWQAPDEDVAAIARPGDGEPAVAMSNMFGAPTPLWIGWQDSRWGAREIACRAGTLDPADADVIGLSRHPYPPVRRLDPSGAADTQLSHCAFEAATFACLPARVAGDALDVEMDANELATYAVWSDSRDGNREIYFKRTDRAVFMTAARLAAGCGPAGDAWIDVEFDLVGTCPSTAEAMARYLVYYGTDPGGPFLNAASPIEVVHDETGPSPVITRIGGLVPGTTYQVMVVPEDQARNVQPQDFEPDADAAVPHASERSIATPEPCAPAPPCLWRSDVTSVRPHVPARDAVYLVPPSGEDISLQGLAYHCPFATGDVDPNDPDALVNGLPLVLYQVNRPVATLRLEKSGRTIRFTF